MVKIAVCLRITFSFIRQSRVIKRGSRRIVTKKAMKTITDVTRGRNLTDGMKKHARGKNKGSERLSKESESGPPNTKKASNVKLHLLYT